MNTPEWVHEPEAAKRLALKPNTLRTMRRERRLEPGEHWVYATGAVGGPVIYNIPAIHKSLAQRTKEMVAAEAKCRAEAQQQHLQSVETYDEAGLEKLKWL